MSSNLRQNDTKAEAKASGLLDTTLEVSSLVLKTLQDGAQFAPVPFLQDAAGVALEILNAVQVRSRFIVSLSV